MFSKKLLATLVVIAAAAVVPGSAAARGSDPAVRSSLDTDLNTKARHDIALNAIRAGG